MKIELKKIILIILVCSFSSCFAQSKLEQNNSLVTKIPFTTNATIKYNIGTRSCDDCFPIRVIGYRFYVDSISLEDKERLKKLSVKEWMTLLEQEETDWAANILLYYIFERNIPIIYLDITKEDWVGSMKDEEMTYWSAFLQQEPRIWRQPEPKPASEIPFFSGYLQAQSTDSICLQSKSVHLEIKVATPPNDSVAITVRFTNHSNKVIGIDDNHTAYYNEVLQTLYSSGNAHRASFRGNEYSNDFYYPIKCIPPGEHILFTIKGNAPPYNKVISLSLKYFSDVDSLVRKQILYHAPKTNLCYLFERPDDYLETILVTFTKDSKEVDVLIPKDCTLCEPTLTPTKN